VTVFRRHASPLFVQVGPGFLGPVPQVTQFPST
jgi:hypothetical protein